MPHTIFPPILGIHTISAYQDLSHFCCAIPVFGRSTILQIRRWHAQSNVARPQPKTACEYLPVFLPKTGQFIDLAGVFLPGGL